MTSALPATDVVRGIAVVVDDKVRSPEGALQPILDQLISAGLPLLLLEALPTQESLVHWKQFGLIVLDWQLAYAEAEETVVPLGVTVPSGLADDSRRQLLDFIRCLLTTTALPIFIASNDEPDSIRRTLETELSDLAFGLRDRVEVFSKTELQDGLFNRINQKIEARPALAVLRAWNRSYIDAEIQTFSQFSAGTEDWVAAVHEATRDDGAATSEALREILSRNIFGRIAPLDHKFDVLKSGEVLDASALRQVMHLSAVLPESALADGHLGTGDLFVEATATEPFSEIRVLLTPDCDLPRKAKVRLTYVSAHRDPQPAKKSKNRAERVRKQSQGSLISCILTPSGDEYTLDVSAWESIWVFARGYEEDRTGEPKLTDDGPLTPEGDAAPVLAGDQKLVDWPGYRRIGRLMEPYLSQVQQALAFVTIRKGVPRIPDDFFNSSVET